MPRSSPARRLRVVVPRYGNEVVGGTETLVRMLVGELHRREWAVEVWTTTALDEMTWQHHFAAGCNVVDGVRVRRFPTVVARDPHLFHQLSRAFFRLPPAVRPEPAWLVAQGPLAPGLTRALSVQCDAPTIFTPYLYRTTLLGMLRCRGPRLMIPAAHDERPLGLRSVARAVRAADGLFYNSPEERDLLERCHPVAASRPNEVGTLGMEAPGDIDGEGFRRRFTGGRPYLLHGGRAAAGKGLDELLRGMSLLRQRRPEALLVLTGESGPSGRPPENGVVHAGLLSEIDRWRAIAGATAVVVPGVLESLSLLALEAWSLGRPALVNGAAAALRGQARRSGGALTFVGATELADQAERIISDPGLAGRLGRSGREYVQAEHRWDAVIERLERLVSAALGRFELRRQPMP